MKFLILPLLTAIAYLDYNEIDWEYGSEVIFNVTQILEKKSVNSMSFTSKSRLKCRFGVDDSLHCHLEDTISNPLYNLIDSFPFEIKFNESGIEKLIVPSSIGFQELFMIKSVVKELHVGIDFMNKPEGTYRQLENCLYGVCMTEFKLKLTTVKDMIGKNMFCRDKKYRTWYPGMSIMIDKKRDLQNCTFMAPWISEDIHKSRMQEDIKYYNKYNFPVHVLKFYESTIIADHLNFISRTNTYDRVYGLQPLDNSEFLDIHEKIVVIYDSVVPAKKFYPEIKDPISVEIISEKSWSSVN